MCSVAGCGQKHTKFIHISPKDTNASDVPMKATSESDANDSAHQVNTFVNNDSQANVIVPTVKVTVNGKYEALALLDNCSTTTFCSEKLVKQLGVRGAYVSYRLNTLTSNDEQKRSMVVNLELTSGDGMNSLKLSNVHVVKSIPLNVPSIELGGYSHLNQLSVSNVSSVSHADLLIGQDHSEALIPLDVRSGDKGEPFAVRTLFGWSINGPVDVSGPAGKRVVSHFVCTSDIDHDIRRLYEIETDNYSDELSWSSEDKLVIGLWDDNVRMVNGHYELPVPWKPDVKFPNNYVVAVSRLKSLLKSLEKRGLMTAYDQEMKKMVESGYAEPVPVVDMQNTGKVWYLPHQAVISEKKPGKVRIVFDCAAKYDGESLNDKAYQGPDLNNKLLNVLLRFRENTIAITADIEAMYNQVRIPSSDRDALRFLWVDESGNVTCYRMTSHLFGGIWCASSSTYALRRVLMDSEVDEIVSKTITDSFYVDDCLDSVTSTAAARQVALGTQQVLSTRGFRLTKFIITDEDVLGEIPEADRAKEVKDLCESQSKALGVSWDVSRDEFYYVVNMNSDDTDVTKRVMLSIIAATYDPLGLIGPVLMCGRIILQEAVRCRCTWDDPVPPDLRARWQHWIESLANHVHKMRFSRCIKPTQFDDSTIELHHFSDASSQAYGCCSYIRCINKTGEVHVYLIMSKSRIAPIKQMTIPRLELQGAVLAAKSDLLLKSELRLDICASFFWTDSKIVLAYLQNDTSRFHVFVGNRVSLITSITDVTQWNHVAGADNPADLITRVQNPDSMDMEKWIHGPEFLRSNKAPWQPTGEQYVLCASDPEVKKSVQSTYVTEVVSHPIDVLAAYYSSWYKLKRALAIWLRLVKILRSEKISGILTVAEVKTAEFFIIKHMQQQSYQQEIERLSSGLPLLKASPLRDLDPVLNGEGVLCVGGRLKYADVLSEVKHPVIICHKLTSYFILPVKQGSQEMHPR